MSKGAILIVEDDPLQRRLIRENLEQEEYQVFEFSLNSLRPGTYIYHLTLIDLGSNVVEDSVTVHVRQDENATTADTTISSYENDEPVVTYNPYFSKSYMSHMEMFAVIVISGLAGMVSIAALAGKSKEFGFD